MTPNGAAVRWRAPTVFPFPCVGKSITFSAEDPSAPLHGCYEAASLRKHQDHLTCTHLHTADVAIHRCRVLLHMPCGNTTPVLRRLFYDAYFTTPILRRLFYCVFCLPLLRTIVREVIK